MRQYRQGDVLLREVSSIPKTLKRATSKDGRFILAEGEATGHAHTVSELDGLLSIDAQNRLFLLTEAGCELIHQEHAPVQIPSGSYEVIIQREYYPAGVKNVAD